MFNVAESIILRATVVVLSLPVLMLAAEEPKAVTPAPVPVQVMTAKKVFIANSPGDGIAPSIGGPNRPYNQFYAAMKSWGRYELVSAPADADLVFEVSFTNSLAGVGGTSSTGCSSSTNPMLRLLILDPKTQVPLWWFAEPIVFKRQMFHAEKATDAFDDAVPKLLEDVKRLVAPAVTN